jgi:hypothetical protein
VRRWSPQDARLRGALFQAERHLRRREFLQATQALTRASAAAGPPEYERVRGLVHLAAAGYRHKQGDARAARRQLERARRRLHRPPVPLHGVNALGLLADVEEAISAAEPPLAAAAEDVADEPAD